MEVSRRSFLAGAVASGFAGFAAPVFAAPTPSLLIASTQTNESNPAAKGCRNRLESVRYLQAG